MSDDSRGNFFERFERSISRRVAVWIVVFGLTFTFLVMIAYGIWGSRKDALDYGTLAFGIGGAVLAAITVYYDRWKGILFLASCILLLAAAGCFIAGHSQSAVAFLVGLISVIILMALTLLFVFIGSRRWLGMFYDAHDTLVVIAVMMFVVYAISFFYHNLGCIRDDTQVSACSSVWFFW